MISENVRQAVIEAVAENKVISIVRLPDKETLISSAEALYEGGIRLIEVTFDRTGKVSACYVKAVTAPISDAKLLAVGGVSAENARDFIDMGFRGVGVGSNLYNKKLIANGDYEAMTKLAKQFVDAVK